MTIDTATEITTAARRMVREARQRTRHTKMYFDAEGHVMAAHEADLHYATRPEWMDEVVATALGGNLTQRDAQDLIDAHAAGMAAAQGIEDEINARIAYQEASAFYLYEIESARQAELERERMYR